MSLYSIYASFRHPQTGREVATIELAMESDSVIAEKVVEITSKAIADNMVSIVTYMQNYFWKNNSYLPLVVAMKRTI